jgi:hypothetical protein
MRRVSLLSVHPNPASGRPAHIARRLAHHPEVRPRRAFDRPARIGTRLRRFPRLPRLWRAAYPYIADPAKKAAAASNVNFLMSDGILPARGFSRLGTWKTCCVWQHLALSSYKGPRTISGRGVLKTCSIVFGLHSPTANSNYGFGPAVTCSQRKCVKLRMRFSAVISQRCMSSKARSITIALQCGERPDPLRTFSHCLV